MTEVKKVRVSFVNVNPDFILHIFGKFREIFLQKKFPRNFLANTSSIGARNLALIIFGQYNVYGISSLLCPRFSAQAPPMVRIYLQLLSQHIPSLQRFKDYWGGLNSGDVLAIDARNWLQTPPKPR
jgi:hypothetical protein